MRSRLYLLTPPELASGGVVLSAFRDALGKALAAGDVASVLIRSGDTDEDRLGDCLDSLVPVIQQAGAAAILEDNADLALKADCDGIQIVADPQRQRTLRRRMGDQRILGVDCGSSRHLAMEAGELDADYVTLSAEDSELLSWWSELMEIPSVASEVTSLEAAAAAVRAGADFVAVGSAVWQNEEPPATVAAFNRLFDELAEDT
ncbi:thiamine phosphate synthase [Fodinicurvata halophila]|uniref:Thiamine phosphate synthase n=1 Tax=Fodinicurvata halophila TaxID=1419723 RepID=A0ABV8UJE4_9PROT